MKGRGEGGGAKGRRGGAKGAKGAKGRGEGAGPMEASLDRERT